MQQPDHTAQGNDVLVTLCVVAMAVPIVVSVVVPLSEGSALLDALIIHFDLGALGLATRALVAATRQL
jgi:hypothetical protein